MSNSVAASVLYVSAWKGKIIILTEAEFEKIIDRYSRLLWSVASKVLDGAGSAQDCEECVADVFIDLWKDPESFDPSRGSLRSWLCMKCRSKAIDRFRSLAAHAAESFDESTALRVFAPETGGKDPCEAMQKGETAEALRKAVDGLGEPEREIMIRRFYLEQKPAAIAAATGLPLRKVENIIYRSKGKLRDELMGVL